MGRTISQPPTGFLCNVCGSHCPAGSGVMERETKSCETCASSARIRAVVRVLSLSLFAKNLILPDFPRNRSIRGLGMSDWEGYAVPLADKFSYVNTYYHKAPQLDISAEIPRFLLGAHDFIISSEVFEHVVPPVHRAFENTFKMLKPGGSFILTVPWGNQADTTEHFPELHEFEITEEDGTYVLRNVTRSGKRQEFRDLVFHNGPGATLEMRVFAGKALTRHLKKAGFEAITVHREADPAHGISWPERWSFPLSARKPR